MPILARIIVDSIHEEAALPYTVMRMVHGDLLAAVIFVSTVQAQWRQTLS